MTSSAAVIGIGGSRDNALRAAVYERLVHLGFELPPVVHARATVADTATLGPGHGRPRGRRGRRGRAGSAPNVIVNTGAVVDHDCVLEDHVHVASGATLGGNVHVSHGAHVGLGASVIQGCRIGELAVVGAGAVVIRDVAAGNHRRRRPGRAANLNRPWIRTGFPDFCSVPTRPSVTRSRASTPGRSRSRAWSIPSGGCSA